MTTIKDIAKLLVPKYQIKTADAELFLQQMVEVINEGLLKDRLVKIKGFGTFKLQTVKERSSVNISTGTRVTIGEHDKVTFTPDNVMRDLVNKPFAQFETVIVDDDSPLLNGDDDDLEPVEDTEKSVEDDTKSLDELSGEVSHTVEDEDATSVDADASVSIGNGADVSVEDTDEVEDTYDVDSAEQESMDTKVIKFIDDVEVDDTEEPAGLTTEKAAEVADVVEEDNSDSTGDDENDDDSEKSENVEEAEDAEDTVDAETIEEQNDSDEAEKTDEAETSEKQNKCELETSDESEDTDDSDDEGENSADEEEDSDDDESDDSGDGVKTDSDEDAEASDSDDEDSDDNEEEEEEEDYWDEDEGMIYNILHSQITIYIIIGVICLAVGYYAGMKGWLLGQTAGSVQKVDTVFVKDTVMQTAPVDTEEVKNDDESAEEQQQKMEEEKPERTSDAKSDIADKYNKDARVRTGAYDIVGTLKEVKVREGETLKKISKTYLGPDMECYVEVYNDIQTVKPGQVIKIPKLELKKRK